jgi:hypothetical protein
MALTKLEGSFSGSSSTPAVDFRNMLNTQFSALGGNWSVVDHNFVSGAVARTVIKNSAGFCFMATTGTTTNATVNFYFGRDYYPTPRTFTITAASSSGTSPNFFYTYTTSINHNLVVGERVTITNISVDTTYQQSNAVITAIPAANQFTIAGPSSRTARTGLAGVATLNPIGTVTNAVGNGTNATYTYTQTSGYDFKVGDSVIIGDIDPVGYNTTATVITATPTTITVENTETATYTSGGFIALNRTTIFNANTIGKRAWSGSGTADNLGFSINTISPTAIDNSTFTSSNFFYNALAAQTNWIIMYENTYAIVGIKDGTTTNGKWFYFGEAESLIENPAITEIAPFVMCGSPTVLSNSLSHIINSIGNQNISINHSGRLIPEVGTNFIGTPGVASTTDLYSIEPSKVSASNMIIVRESSTIRTAVETNVNGWKRFRLNDIVFAFSTGSSWGDTTEIAGSTYQYIGGTTDNVSDTISAWVRTN